MRPIDADNLLIALSNAFCTGNIGYREAENVVNDQDTIAPEILRPTAHWISVNDRLPDFYVGVFVYDNCSYESTIACRIKGNNGGWIWYSRMFRPEDVVNVTHWMPLPEPPKETLDE